jgi:hypothetical protein
VQLEDRFPELSRLRLDALEQRSFAVIDEAVAHRIDLGSVALGLEKVTGTLVRGVVALFVVDREDELAAAVEIRPTCGAEIDALQE